MKNYRVMIMPTAKEGLLEIAEYIALDNPTRAISFIDELTSALKNSLSIFPYAGRVAENLNLDEEIRTTSHGNYNSYYRILDDAQVVEVLFIFNASRDIEALISQIK